MRNFLTLLLLLPIALSPSFAQSSEEVYIQIKGLVDSSQWDKAQTELDRVLSRNPNDATLQLYQNFVWIGKADLAYANRKFLTAYGYYEKVFKAWPSHPGVRNRYLELKAKEDLKDLQEERSAAVIAKEERGVKISPQTQVGSGPSKAVFIFDPSLQETSARVKFEYDELLKSIEEAKKNVVTKNNIQVIESFNPKFLWLAIAGITILSLINTFLLIRK
ncbi:hypothetical protein LEP1GSC047_1374 [Leptospira inadai serovar Lyme str. 10]|uniref:Tetratricopeptide repeat protein n=2 Tax=Leptospira inadai serovar Lyme TaxID=293084 RepID=V6HQM7_9LEPT|nr:hypothetical protein [Leptospira inadai]EQA34764.1 hypothetical protein LEP1GSC047_1374 [Leptospira inadai serovar Lyme str. 10]PNV75273.1 hypothetical protein BES34_008385 [Leptospira inadai serovar Lyme]